MEAWKFSDWEQSGKDEGINIRKRPKHEEDKLQQNCIRFFDIQYPNLRYFMMHTPNEGKRSEKEGARNKAMGVRRGFPDLLLLHTHSLYDYLAIEIKTQTGRLSDEQKEYRSQMLAHGGCYCIIRSLEDFQKCLSDYFANNDMQLWIDKK